MTQATGGLRDVIRSRRAEIVDRFVDEVGMRGLAGRPLPRQVLLDDLGDLVDDICATLEMPSSPAAADMARAHAFHRWEDGFDFASLVREYSLLRELIVAAAGEGGHPPSASEAEGLASAMNVALAAAIEAYARFRDELAARQVRELEEARAVLDTLLMAAPLGFAYLDAQLRYRLVNDSLARMNGVPASRHLGLTPMRLLPKTASFFERMHRAVLATGQPQSAELVAETPAEPGRTRTFTEHWYPVRAHGEIIGIGLLVEDISQRRAAELFRDRIIGVVSHDLRNPVQAIATAAALMVQREGIPDDVRRLSGPILRGVSRMTNIIEQLFDYVRLDREGRLALDRARFDLADLVHRILEESELAFFGRKLDTRLEVEGNTQGEWDQGRLAQVLTNLVRNAVQHGDGAVSIRVRGDADAVTIEVENGGAPIPTALLERIFEPFHSLAEGTAHLGLGLYISRQIVIAHGGTMGVRSDARATVFTVSLPRAPSGAGRHDR